MLVERVRSDDEIIAPLGLACEPHRLLRAVQKTLALSGLHFDLACNDYGHVSGEDVGTGRAAAASGAIRCERSELSFVGPPGEGILSSLGTGFAPLSNDERQPCATSEIGLSQDVL